VPARARSPLELTLRAAGRSPTTLTARLQAAGGRVVELEARDSARALQGAGEPGVLATAQTLFPSDPNPVLPALGNLHLLPWSVQEGQAVMATALGQAVVAEIRRRSTAGFGEIVVRAPARPRRSRPAVLAATTGAPVAGGARLQIAADMPARVSVEIAGSPHFTDPRVIEVGPTGDFAAAVRTVRGLEPGRRVWWRARLERRGRTSVGPVRSFRVLGPSSGAGSVRIAIGSCASQFGPIFGHLAESEPDVFVWQGDLNYPDTHGPLAQTISGYAGIWRDFLANPVLTPLVSRAALAGQRDDHDFAVQDANAATIPDYPWGLAPWEALVNRRTYYRFAAGPAEVWVLDQRLFKTDPETTDGPGKTLLGARQRRWLERSLAASPARFKVICSPTTVFMPANARDGNWAAGYAAERERLLTHIADHVEGAVIFVTGDTHLTGVYDDGRNFEARAAPLCIPRPNDITLVDPLAASRLRGTEGIAYAGDESHFALLDVAGSGRAAKLELALVREDGERVYSKVFRAG
jgi:hypothetical protein